jgi:cytochrome P450 PksS
LGSLEILQHASGDADAGNGILTLLEHPQQMAQLRATPSGIETAVDELLRYAGPLDMATERFAREDISLGDITIPRDAVVYAVLASANRDEGQFHEPNRLDLTRQPNRHVAFGQGIHFCLGAPLARLEGQVAIRALLQRTDGLRLAVPQDAIPWRKGLVLRGVIRLPVIFERRL